MAEKLSNFEASFFEELQKDLDSVIQLQSLYLKKYDFLRSHAGVGEDSIYHAYFELKGSNQK